MSSKPIFTKLPSSSSPTFSKTEVKSGVFRRTVRSRPTTTSQSTTMNRLTFAPPSILTRTFGHFCHDLPTIIAQSHQLDHGHRRVSFASGGDPPPSAAPDQLGRASRNYSRLPPATFRPRRRRNRATTAVSPVSAAGHCVVNSDAGELRPSDQMVVWEPSAIEGSLPTRLQPNRRPGRPDFFTHRRRHYSHPKLRLFQFSFFSLSFVDLKL